MIHFPLSVQSGHWGNELFVTVDDSSQIRDKLHRPCVVYKTKFVLKVLFENDGQLYNANRGGKETLKKKTKRKA